MNRKLIVLGGSLYSATERALFAALTAPHKVAAKNAIRAMQASGAWALMDGFYMTAAGSPADALVNWKSPGTFNLTETVTPPTYSTDLGITGAGASSGLNGPNLSTYGGQFTLNNCHLGVWVGTNIQEGTVDVGVTSSHVRARQGATNIQTRANDTTATNSTIAATSIGHTMWSRAISTAYDPYKNGVALGTISVTTTSITNTTLGVCFGGGTSSTKRIQAAHFGAALTQAQVTSVYNALAAYMTAIGA